MDVREFHATRRFADTASGRIAYLDQGDGPAALFVHGVPLNGFHWRHIIAGVRDLRRCIAVDLMGLGYSEIAADCDVSFSAQARMLGEVLDTLGIDRVDLVGNDSGGAISQIFAARHPERVRTLTLTNCDVHDGWPPEAIQPALERARQGTLADVYQSLLDDPETGRDRLRSAYIDTSGLTDEILGVYLRPVLATAHRRELFHRYWNSFDNSQTTAIEPALRQLRAPTLVVWALDDIYFDVKWAHWLKQAIPGAERLVEVPDARLFFPEDRPQALIGPLRELLISHPA